MTDKPPLPQAGFFALPDHHIVSLTGRDALAFIQAQGMNDVSTLADGHWQWNGWLTPKGRVIALFALLRLDAETAWLLLPDADADALVSALQRFVFRSKVAITVRDDLAVSGAFAPTVVDGAAIGGDSADGLLLDVGAAGGTRTLRIAPSSVGAISDPDAVAHWRAFDLRHGLPRLETSQSGQWTPHQLSLERLHAFSVKKGCYPGQEIVARTHFLGQAKRALALCEAQGNVSAGDAVVAGEDDIGQVVCRASGPDTDRDLALVVLRLDAGQVQLRIGGSAAQRLPLMDGLAR